MLKFMTGADVTPREFSDWYLFNTWMQKQIGEKIRLDIPINVRDVQQHIENDNVDIVYANPYDAAMLVRDHNYVPVARPDNQNDEVVIITQKNNPIEDFTALKKRCKIALTDDRDVKMIGMILIEPADLNEDNVKFLEVGNGVVAAKQVINGKADIGFILSRSYDTYSRLITGSVRELIRSQISVINHALMVKPHVLEKVPNLQEILSKMHEDKLGKSILEGFGMHAWLPVEQEDVEFMIDLMETLK